MSIDLKALDPNDITARYYTALGTLKDQSAENHKLRAEIENLKLEIESLKQPLKCPCCYCAVYPK